jgi:predicted DsbA family dithiol-disulfide isomerase
MTERVPMSDRAGARPRVLLFFDYACSFCYVDQVRFDRLAHEYDVEVVRIPFELRPDIPDSGVSARAQGLEHSERVEEHLQRITRQEGLPYRPVDHIPNTHKAMVAGEVARDAGEFRRFQQAIFEAYFGEGRDIGEQSVLIESAVEVGLDPESVVEAWSSGTYEDRLHAFYHLALDLGVTATPAALICNELLVGTRPYGVVRDAVERCLITPDNVESHAEPSGSVERDE